MDMDAYAPGGVLRNRYSLHADLTSLAANGLAWSADDSVLAAVTATDSSSSPHRGRTHYTSSPIRW